MDGAFRSIALRAGLARSPIRFSERPGETEDDGSVRMAPLTHEMLSQHVGASREIVTHYINQFRRMAYIRYSRKGIILYRDAFQDWLRQAAQAELNREGS